MSDNNALPSWMYNEFHASGVDYADLEVVRNFEERHLRFRDFDAEFHRICERTGLKPSDSALDLGCGSGAFTLRAAKYCRQVCAADVSKSMLALLKRKLDEERGQETPQERSSAGTQCEVKLYNAGLLTFWARKDRPEKFDFIISSIALHHLPDFWKGVAIQQIADALKPGGVFYLYDVVFTFPIQDWHDGVERLLNEMENAAGREANAHISSEYSTFSWYLEGIFDRVGLKVEKIFDDSGFLRAYVCRKVDDTPAPPLTVAETRAVDSNAAQSWRVPTLLLMENAARSLAEVFVQRALTLSPGSPLRTVLICCGKGNNGGDGFALFRRLELLGINCHVVTFAPFDAYKGDALANLQIVQAMTKDAPEKLFYADGSRESLDRLEQEFRRADWIVDALLGTGATGPLRAPYDTIVPLINMSGKPVYAVDVPSGLNADDGSVATDSVKATLTTTLAAMKKGLLTRQAQPYVGELHVGDIGVPVAPLLDS